MSQTILTDFVAHWEESRKRPNLKEFGFSTMLDMLQQAEEVMLDLGESANRNRNARELAESRLKHVEEQLQHADEMILAITKQIKQLGIDYEKERRAKEIALEDARRMATMIDVALIKKYTQQSIIDSTEN